MPEQELFLILLVLVAVLVIAGAVLAWKLERRRQEAIARVAANLGLEFSPDRDHELARRYESLRGLHEGSNRYAFDVLRGNYESLPVTIFDFHHETHSTNSKGGRQTHHHYQHVVLLHLSRAFPNLLISPEGVFSKIAQALGYDDIDFESYEFSRRFCVRSPDKRFAYDFCHSAMIEFLLANPDLNLEVQADVLALVFPNRLTPSNIESELMLLPALHEKIPAYLFTS